MNALNAILTKATALVLAPFTAAPALGLVALSIVLGVVMTIVFGRTSNQAKLRAAAGRTRAMVLGLRLFKDDFGVAMRCQADLLRATGARLLHSLPPLLVLGPPIVLVLIQLAARYEFRPLLPGESVVVEAAIDDDAWSTWRDAALAAPTGAAVETPGVRDDAERTITWRVGIDGATTGPLVLTAGAQTVEKSLAATDAGAPITVAAPRRPGRGVWDRLLHPAEPALGADDGVASIVVHYPRRATPILGLNLPWWATFFIVSMIAALVARPFLRVQF